jgi:hypothetical protein
MQGGYVIGILLRKIRNYRILEKYLPAAAIGGTPALSTQ